MTNLNKTTIKQIIDSSKESPFAPFYVIVKDKLLVEEAFLKATDSLFNVEIVTYNEMIARLKDMYRLNSLKLPDQDASLLFLMDYLEANDFTTFKKPSIATTRQLLGFIKMAHDYKCTFEYEKTSPLSKTKLDEFKGICSDFDSFLDGNTRLGFEDEIAICLDDSISSWHMYFALEGCTLRQDNLIESLARYAKVTRLEHSSHSQSDLGEHLETHFFSSDSKSDIPTPYFRLDLGVDSMQYTQVASKIFEEVKKGTLEYRDIAIVTNDAISKEKMARTLAEFKIPSNGALSQKNNPYLALLSLSNYLVNNDSLALQAFLTNPAVKSGFGKLDQINFKKTGIMPETILDGFFMEQRAKVSDHVSRLSRLLDDHFVPVTSTMQIKSQLASLGRYDSTLRLGDFFDLLIGKIEPQPVANAPLASHVYLLDLSSPWLEILDIKQVFVLSCNEDVYPKKIKNNKILLDDELRILRLPTIKDALDNQNRLILALFASGVEKMVFCGGMYNRKSEPLLLSSTMKNLFKRYKWQKEPVYKDTAHPLMAANLYLDGTVLESKGAINDMIDRFQASANQPEPLSSVVAVSKLSPSQIETYNSCPFKYFLNYHASLRPLQEAKIQANQTGTLIHHLIEQSQEFIENYDFEKLPGHLKSLTDQFVSDNRIPASGYNSLLLRRIQDDMVVTLAILNRQHQLSHSSIIATEKYASLDTGDLFLHGKIDRVDALKDYVGVVDYKGSAKKLDENYLVLGVNIQMIVYLYMMARQSNLKAGGVFYFNYAPVTLNSKDLVSSGSFDSSALLKEKRMVALLDEAYSDMLEDVEDGDEAQVFKGKKTKKGSWTSTTPVRSQSELETLMDDIIHYIEKLNGNLGAGMIPIAPIVSDIEDKLYLKPCTYCDYKAICKFDPFYNEYRNLEKEVERNESK